MKESQIKIEELLKKSNGFEFSNHREEPESQDYWASTYELNRLKIRFRKAKITPNKNGQFVTIWKRLPNGPITPFHQNDEVDLVVILVEKRGKLGQFVFPKTVLCSKGIFSTDTLEGKRGIRVYPPWDVPQSKQAMRTQAWQINYFLDLEKTCDHSKAAALYLQV
ncbi:MAG: MepB family protein [Reichenbachiella sp.]|uniref:MepB family protein n=1 Tax=Reichenbachiella sp. TaxID=2184521 RepID=UPI003266E52B